MSTITENDIKDFKDLINSRFDELEKLFIVKFIIFIAVYGNVI